MTAEDVAREVEAIRAISGDAERAHGMEDSLRENVLREIANGVVNAAELAREALKTGEIDFPRWCA